MRGFTIQNSIDELEKKVKALEDGGGETPTAADISYDNTTSLLTADDVQAEIDEVNTKASEALAGIQTALTGAS